MLLIHKQMSNNKNAQILTLSQLVAGKVWKDEGSSVDVRVVVAAKLLLLLAGPLAEWDLDVGLGVLAADEETNLAGWVGWDGGVSVLDDWEDLAARLDESLNHVEMEPLVLS